MAKSIKLWDYIKVITEDGEQKVDSFPDLWNLFGWDIENDSSANECADIIVRELFCFHKFDMTKANNGNLLYLVAVREDNAEEENENERN